MKVKDLIEKLSQFPQNADVVLYDWERNAWHADEEGSGEGVYNDFEVHLDKEGFKRKGKKVEMVTFDFKSDYPEIMKEISELQDEVNSNHWPRGRTL